MKQYTTTIEEEIEEYQKPRKHEILIFSLRALILGLVLAGIGFLNPIGFGLNANAFSAPFHHILISVGQAIAISFIIKRSKLSGITLVGSIFLFYYALVPFLTAIETAIFVPDLPVEVIIGVSINGIINALVISVLGSFLFEKLNVDTSFSLLEDLRNTPLIEWIWKITAIGAIYILVYILSGALIFLPIAGDAINLVYSDLDMPEWILQFQYFRGILWALVTIPILRSLRGDIKENQLLIGFSYVLLVATLILMPGGISVLQVQLAHFIELVIGHCIIFGIIVTRLFRRK